MAAACQTIPAADAFASNLLAFLDCQASTLGAGGYQSLSASGATGALLVGMMLTLFIALWGYRLLLGDMPTVRDLVLAAIKVGVVLTLATSWPAYQTLIYDVVLRAPAQLASEIGASQDLPGASGGLAARLDGAEVNFRQLEIMGAGSPQTPEQQAAVRATVPPPLFPNFDTFALGMARLAFLGSTLGSFALVRLAAGILLALGPIFAGFLFFEATRPLFAGWLKALLGTALGALAISVVLGVELALLEPWLQYLVALRVSQAPILGVPGQLLAVSLIFAVTLIGVMLVLGRVATGSALSLAMRRLAPINVEQRADPTTNSRAVANEAQAVLDGRARALAVADAIVTTQRREAGVADMSRAATYAVGAMRASSGFNDGVREIPLGQSYRRRTGNRVSARANERDRRS